MNNLVNPDSRHRIPSLDEPIRAALAGADNRIGGGIMGSVARVTTITARSESSFEDAIRVGIDRANQTLRNLTGAWVKEQEVKIENGTITEWEVVLEVTFVLD
jgi:dodecin